MFIMEPKPRIIADAFIMEQLEDFSGENLQKFTALLKPDADYISLTMESDNSIAIAFIDVVALDQKWNFEDAIEVAKAMESFRIQAIEVMNDMTLESENQMCEFAGLSTYLFRPVPREDAPCIPVVDEPTPSHDWVLTDNDCAQYVRFVEDGVYDLIQVIALPEDFQIARGRIFLTTARLSGVLFWQHTAMENSKTSLTSLVKSRLVSSLRNAPSRLSLLNFSMRTSRTTAPLNLPLDASEKSSD